MEWAEEVGIGELGLDPHAFWSLTVREFWIKHRAFTRSELRQQALVIEHAARTADYKASDRERLFKYVNALRRYPTKPWLNIPE